MKTKLLLVTALLFSMLSSYAQAPFFSGLFVSSITSSSAEVSCNVNGNFSLTTGYFAISTSVNDLLNGNPGTIPFNSIPANVGTLQPRNKVFTGLLPATTYYYRAVALNTWGQTVTAYASFQTLSAPITNVLVSDITNTSVKVNYTANGQAVYSNVSYGFEPGNYFEFVGGIQTNLLPSVSGFVPLTNLTAGTTYYAKVNAQANVFGSYSSQEFSFTTTGTTAGPGVSTPTLTAITGTSAMVNFQILSQSLAHSSIVKYGTSAASLNLQTAVDNVAIGNNVSAKAVPLTDLSSNTTYFYQIEATNADGTTTSVIKNFTTLVVALPTITAVSHSAGSNIPSVSYTINPNNSASTSVINYGLSQDAMTGEAVGLTAAQNPVTGTVQIDNLLANTTYYYQIEATNSSGTTLSAIGNFTTLTPPVIGAVAEYSFDNTYTNLMGVGAFATNGGISFTTDRHGNANKAINVNNTGSVATIPNLPYGAASRSVSIWVKLNTFNAQPYNFMFSYGGNNTQSKSFGGSISASNAMVLGYNNNYLVASNYSLATWYHYVATYNGNTVKIYKNGVLLGSGNFVWDTVNNNDLFNIGKGVGGEFWFNGALDDLKIYNYTLTDAEILNLYNFNSVLSTNFNQKNLQVSLYPNPANDVLNIATDTEIQSVEIYNIQGQSVLVSNQKQISVTNLSSGIYMVKIVDTQNDSTTKKIIID